MRKQVFGNSLEESLQKEGFAEETLIEKLSNYPIVRMVLERGKQIGYLFLFLILSLLLISQFLSKRTLDKEQDLVKATALLKELQEGTKVDETLSSISTILDTHPNLKPLFDGEIAEALIVLNEPLKALPFAERNLKRVESFAPKFSQEYAKTSLLIALQKNEEALKKSYALKESLYKAFEEKSATFQPGLYAFNLIRIAFLERGFQNVENEAKAFSELEAINTGKSEIKLQKLEKERINAHFNNETVKLKEFVNK